MLTSDRPNKTSWSAGGDADPDREFSDRGGMGQKSQIAVDGVSHLYRPPKGRAVLALEDVSLEVAGEEFIALLGPSGCGKSTLLYLIGGFLEVGTGHITVDGRTVAGPGPDRLWRALKYECVYLRAFSGGREARQGIGDWIAFYNPVS